MLIFRRKKREQIVIDGNIVVTIMHIRGTRVSLGIQAPEGVRILRSELSPHEISALSPQDVLAPLPLADSLSLTSSALPMAN